MDIKELKIMIEKWNNSKHLDDWENFPETMWAMGFEMDCHESYKQLFNDNLGSSKEERQTVIKNLKTADMQIVGNFIFSHWRYLTHWSYGYDINEEKEYFKELFKVLLCKEK